MSPVLGTGFHHNQTLGERHLARRRHHHQRRILVDQRSLAATNADRSGSLTAIVGRIGVGKTSLLSAILGDIYKVSGNVIVCGSMAYVTQQPFILSGSLRDNILFGRMSFR
ncbi:hypothetical protein BC936DRAFT_147322 [Jimgerdemannia flammicorona]|uniref:ABC transporter domain-containing protein n=1 Tax=Jimgerdemannia flammicorona TaxID=994334 RepID=A0A433DL09_9FUNG|nr:hypothetical protein BC936DRAFT_147322 [Jimgerdemannia flammicorona]